MSAAVGDLPDASPGFEVATTATDTLRAGVVVTGDLSPAGSALLLSVLRSHLGAGRRYLRIDLAAARITDSVVVEDLVRAHRDVSGLGGMLVFENVGPELRDLAESDTLYLRGPV